MKKLLISLLALGAVAQMSAMSSIALTLVSTTPPICYGGPGSLIVNVVSTNSGSAQITSLTVTVSGNGITPMTQTVQAPTGGFSFPVQFAFNNLPVASITNPNLPPPLTLYNINATSLVGTPPLPGPSAGPIPAFFTPASQVVVTPVQPITAQDVLNGTLGSITFNVTGGSGSYTFTFDSQPPQGPSAGQFTFSGLTAGTYTFSVVDSNGCAAVPGSILIPCIRGTSTNPITNFITTKYCQVCTSATSPAVGI